MSTQARRPSVPPEPGPPPLGQSGRTGSTVPPARPAGPLPPPAPPMPAAPPPGPRPQARQFPPAAHFAPPPPVTTPVHAPAPAETTIRLRPVPGQGPVRTAAAVLCVVLGLGLVGGAAAGSWLIGTSSGSGTEATGYSAVRALWHDIPVDELFPRTVQASHAGPGGADRTWTRLGVAPDGDCEAALDPALTAALRSVGCARVVRATYTDATSSSVTTVGMVFTKADAAAMSRLHSSFTTGSLGTRTDLMPRAYPVPGTDAAHFGDAQRASWVVDVLSDEPVVVFAVSGFADGRAVATPVPAAQAERPGATSVPAQAGLGNEAGGIAQRIQAGLRRYIGPGTVVAR
jgi:hypothetical protein